MATAIKFFAMAGLWAAVVACDPEVIIYERPAERREVGLPCALDGECSSGRCSAGVCIVNQCESDADCRANEICNPITHQCESLDNFACAPGQTPILQLDSTSYSFGTVTVSENIDNTVIINNIGDCLLTIQQAQILPPETSDPDNNAIVCQNCGVDVYPKAVPPGHSAAIVVRFQPSFERQYSAVLAVRSDDMSFEDGIARVQLAGEGLGHPRLSIDPPIIDFGNVGITAPAASASVTVSNVGAGTLRIDRVFIDPFTSPISVSPSIGPTSPQQQLELFANQSQVFQVQYDPSDLSAHQAILFIVSNDTTRSCTFDPNNTPGVGCVELKGDSRGPPVIQVSHTAHNFGDMYLGESAAEMITITNAGQSDLTLSAVGMTVLSSSDFSYTPPNMSVIPPGVQVYMTVRYDATQLNRATATLQVQSNDPVTPLAQISFEGFGLSPFHNDVLKLEMSYENGDNGFFANDFRDVNLYLESPVGLIVDKQTPIADWTGGGANDQRNYGHPQWNAIGVNEEPERVVLFDAHEDAYGTFKGCVTYREDCAKIPTDILAGLLGIGTSALIAGLTEGIISPDAGDVSDFIRNNCWDHDSSRVKIATYVNGAAVAEHSVNLGRAGDYACPVTIQRINGQYCVTGASPPQAGCP